ncbi:hypothetical protein [Methylobacterium sp. P5_C11]
MDLDDGDAVVDTYAGPQGTDTARRQAHFTGLDVPDRPDRRRAGSAIPEKNIRPDAARQAVADDVSRDEALLDAVPADPGKIQLAQAGRERRVDLNSVEEPFSRLGALDDFLQDIKDLIGLGINPRIARPVLSRDDERSASARPSAGTVSRLIMTKPRFDLEKTQGDECKTESKPCGAAI